MTSQIPVGFIQRAANLPSFIYTFPVFEQRFFYQSSMIYNIVRNAGEIFICCSIDDDLNVKVTDCALSRDLFPQDYCCLGDNENRPVKWMAVECLEQGRYTVSSDVVSVKSRGTS